MSAEFLSAFFALAAGATVGYPFGLLHAAALRRNEQLAREGKTNPTRAIWVSRSARTAYLILTLLAIQMICPFLFRAGTQWWVSGGVMLGYGWTLVRQMVLRLKEAKK